MADWGAVRAEIAVAQVEWLTRPVVPTWSRLEPLTLTRGDLTPGTQALLADPLWLLGRQWQFDELRGEDGGSPVRATVVGETAPLSRFRAGAGDGPAVDLDLPDVVGAWPLETRVEAEVPAVLPVRLRTHTGLRLVRMLRAAGLAAAVGPVAAQWPFPAARTDDDDPTGDARLRLVAGRVPDGAAVAADLAPWRGADGTLTDLPPALAGVADAGAVRDTLGRWAVWADGVLAAPSGQSWDPHRLEHRFAVAATLSDGAVTHVVDEYTGGTLDWFHGDLHSGVDLGPAPAAATTTPVADTTLPAPVRFAGMPSDRLFAFEDAAVHLGGVDAGRTDLARLAVVEFALAYGVDWFQVPLVLPYGSVTRLDRVEVVDTFGVVVPVRPSREVAAAVGRPAWTAFSAVPATDSSRRADMLLLAPTVARVQEGAPLEEVALFRDEMANLVWGVERVVPDAVSGEAVVRARTAARVTLAQPTPTDLGDAEIVYRLMTPVPANWIPFVAVRDRPADPDSHHELERRPMLRYGPDGVPSLVHPLGTVLRADAGGDVATDRLRIAEQEVPRDGVVVTRCFQAARTVGGGSVLWIGRRVRTGQGEGASGLRFDTALPPGT